MAGVALASPRFQFFDAVGNPLDGGWVDIYLAGTTTRVTTWQDRAMSSQNTNPIELDPTGSCYIVLDPAITYKFVVKNSNLVVQTHLGADNVVGVSGVSVDAAQSAAIYAGQALEYRDDAAESAAAAAAVSGSYVGLTKTAIKALNTSTVQVAHLKDEGKEGVFDWDSSDHSSFMEVESITATGVSATKLTKYGHNLDTGAGIYVESAAYGLTPYVLYFAGYVDADEFRVADSFDDANVGNWRTLTVTSHVPIIRHADPHEGRFIIPNGLKCDGSQGAWVRIPPPGNYWNAAWFGMDETFDHNQSILTAAIHACPEGSVIVAPAGTYPISKCVQMRWREKQTLLGLGLSCKLEGPDSTTASSVIRVMKSGCRVIGMSGGKFTGQVPGEFTVNDANLSESCGVHVFPHDEEYIEDVRVEGCWFYEVDSGVTVAGNHDQLDDATDPGRHVYYMNTDIWIDKNRFTDIRRQGIEVFINENVYVTNNTVVMTEKGVGFSTSRAVRLCGCVNVTVSGNRFYGHDESVSGELGISIEPASMSLYDDPIAIRYCANVNIFGNYTENFNEHYHITGTKGFAKICNNVAAGNPNPAQPSSTVTITNASPGVVTWSNNLLPNGTVVTFTTTGALPEPLVAATEYYVINRAANTFQLSLTEGGSAINTTTAGSGTHTGTAPYIEAASRAGSWFLRQTNSGYSEATSVPDVRTVTLPLASPGVVTWTGNNMVADDEVKFYTDGTLPTEVVSGTTYYVRNRTTNTFELATSAGGASIDFTGATAGTHHIVPARWYPSAKNITKELIVTDNFALSLAYFFETQGAVLYQEFRRNTFIGNGKSDSRMVNFNNLNDTPAIERCEMSIIEDNLAITNQLGGSSILLTNGRSSEYYSINRNRMSGGSTGLLFSEGGTVTTGGVYMDSPTSNELLPSGLWASHFNPPPEWDEFDIGSLA